MDHSGLTPPDSPDSHAPDSPEGGAPVMPPAPAPRPGWVRAVALVALGAFVGGGVAWAIWGGDGRGAGDGGTDATVAGGATIHGVDVTNDPVLGPDDAPVTIVEFSDFECPFCARFATVTAPLLRRQYGDRIRWIFVNTPLKSIHPNAYDAALAGECAAEQDLFWPYYDVMFSGRFQATDDGLYGAAEDVGLEMERFGECYQNADHASEVAADEREAQRFYILGTPTFFVNGHRLEGAQPPEVFAAVIDSILSGT